MKKIIGLLAILLVTTGVFGQTRGASLSDFRTNKSFEIFQSYYFQENGEQYAVAYDSRLTNNSSILKEGDMRERTLSLYRMDGATWTRVSNVMKTDYWKKVNGVQSYDYHADNMPYQIERGCDFNELASCKGIGYSSVESKNDIITIRMLSFCGVVGVDGEYNYRWDTYKLIPQKNKTYLATKYTE